MTPHVAGTALRCPYCHRLVLVNSDGYAVCDCGAVYALAIKVEREPLKAIKTTK